MDLSKLPKLSESSQSVPPPAAAAPSEPQEKAAPIHYARTPAPSVSGDVWFNLVVAAILLYMGRSFLFWTLATVTGQAYHTNVNWMEGPNAGTEVSYFELSGFTAMTDTGMFLFGLAILFECAVVAIDQIKPCGPSRTLVLIALGLTVLCTLFNLLVCIKLMSAGIAPLMSGLAVAFGGYMVISLRGVLQNSTALIS